VQRATAQPKTGIFNAYGVAEASPILFYFNDYRRSKQG
jgi:hypothetical protein